MKTVYVNNILYRAVRLMLAGTPDYYAVLSSNIEPLPHQLDAVYNEMMPLSPLRYVLADDPGAGKTIMTGLLIKEMFIRKRLTRCLIVSPGPLAEQWQDELMSKFHLEFSILNEDDVPEFCIARLDTLARSKSLQDKAAAISWDLVVIDEAHKLSAQVWAGETSYTKRFQLGRKLSSSTSNLLLLTATPHNGKPQEFKLFMSLVGSNAPMRRLLKEDLLTFDGAKLFTEREAITVSYKLFGLELDLYEQVTGYVRNEFNRADSLSAGRRHSIGFALTILQRRLASSPEAIYQSLTRRLQRLSEKLSNARLTDDSEAVIDDDNDNAADFLTASQTITELEAEIAALRRLIDTAANVRASGKDIKWSELSRLLQGYILRNTKLIIFTEHRDTLNYLAERMRTLLGQHEAVVTIHGGLSRRERKDSESRFRHDDSTHILIATDAAGEGINLQCTNLMVNYDIPWNPNRLEQRFGRIHRIGQGKTCYLWNLVASNTREGQVVERLLDKLNEERKALGGQVFDILGRLAPGGMNLRDLLVTAIRRGTTGIITHGQVVRLLNERSESHSRLMRERALGLRSRLRDNENKLLHPKFIEAFFIEAFTHLRGTMYERGKGLWEITYVPSEIFNRDERIRTHYPRICFDKKYNAEVIMQGHPLLDAVVSVIIERYSDAKASTHNASTPEARSAVEKAAMSAVMKIERELGNDPRDVSLDKCGYDIESATPDGDLRFIEVKGRKAGADTVTVTTGEIYSALRNPRESILAIVFVDGDNTHTTYLMHPFTNEPDDSAASVTFSIAALIRKADCVYHD